MSSKRDLYLDSLRQFLRSIQRPGILLEDVGLHDNLVQAGLIDSLAVVQIAMYLENTYNIDFSADGYNFEQLFTISNILQMIEDKCT